MTNISTSYDAIIAKAESLFPNKSRIHNPYELTDNSELLLKDSWGLKTNGAERLSFEFCNLSISREYTFILVRLFPDIGADKAAFDAPTKSILEDQQIFLNNIWSPNELGLSEDIDQILINSISGIDFINSDQKKYLFAELTFTITLSTEVI